MRFAMKAIDNYEDYEKFKEKLERKLETIINLKIKMEIIEQFDYKDINSLIEYGQYETPYILNEINDNITQITEDIETMIESDSLDDVLQIADEEKDV